MKTKWHEWRDKKPYDGERVEIEMELGGELHRETGTIVLADKYTTKEIMEKDYVHASFPNSMSIHGWYLSNKNGLGFFDNIKRWRYV